MPDEPLPIDRHLGRFLRLHADLTAARRWWESTQLFPHAATLQLTAPGNPRDRATEAAESARGVARSARIWDVTWQLRWLFGSLLAAHGRPATELRPELERLREDYADRSLKRRGALAHLSMLVFWCLDDDPELRELRLDRMAALHRALGRSRSWITGADDLAGCALVVSLIGREDDAVLRFETAYEALHAAGMPRGNGLQLAALVLAALPIDPREGAHRVADIAAGLVHKRVRIVPSDYDELVPFAPFAVTSQVVVHQILADRDAATVLVTGWQPQLRFQLGCGLAASALLDEHDLEPEMRRAVVAATHTAVALSAVKTAIGQGATA